MSRELHDHVKPRGHPSMTGNEIDVDVWGCVQTACWGSCRSRFIRDVETSDHVSWMSRLNPDTLQGIFDCGSMYVTVTVNRHTGSTEGR
jgi:hypothetical protein